MAMHLALHLVGPSGHFHQLEDFPSFYQLRLGRTKFWVGGWLSAFLRDTNNSRFSFSLFCKKVGGCSPTCFAGPATFPIQQILWFLFENKLLHSTCVLPRHLQIKTNMIWESPKKEIIFIYNKCQFNNWKFLIFIFQFVKIEVWCRNLFFISGTLTVLNMFYILYIFWLHVTL
mgnify:CR=1 FL=1